MNPTPQTAAAPRAQAHTERSALARHHAAVRERSRALAAPLSPEDSQAQSMPDASPTKWHLAHVTWFFETFVLERFEPGFQPFHPAFRMLFNSYYNGVGDKHLRAERGLVSSSARAWITRWRASRVTPPPSPCSATARWRPCRPRSSGCRRCAWMPRGMLMVCACRAAQPRVSTSTSHGVNSRASAVSIR